MNTLRAIFTNSDLRKRILYTLGLLVIFRMLAHIPMPGVDLASLREFFARNELFGLLNLFTGGSMENFSLVLMGVGPYITSSIIFQLLVVIVPRLEELQKEGEQGRQKINQYTRVLTVPLGILQGYGTLFLLRNQGVIDLSLGFDLVVILLTITAGSMLLMWFGELISENGIGNGISLIITLSILAGIPTALSQTFAVADQAGVINLMLFALATLATTVAIVYVNEAERQIPITYARRVRGLEHRAGGVATTLPLKVIMAGVIPIIFALSMMIFPPVVARFAQTIEVVWVQDAAEWVTTLFNNNTFYAAAYFVLVVIFTFFYTFVIFQPEQVAENIQRQGGFVPGIRPGRETAEYLGAVLNRITLFGSLFLGLIAVLPFVIQGLTAVQTLVLGGTGILIVVAVTLDTMRQIRAHLITRRYEF
ncbi:preprotein translocase subunit SecY [Candidatus Berkelbacteria bacterium]|nr:preprotein translocase subunit SecY [Candidatus Berkelbacteria bacterium]